MDYLEKMKKNEAYISHFMEMPRELQTEARKKLKEYEELGFDEGDKKREVLKSLFGTYHPHVFPGEGFRCEYGFNIHFHGFAVMNFNVVMLDTSPINLGNGVFIGPGTCLACSGHSLIPEERNRGIGTSAPITIEDNVWLGANVTVIGGVTIGEGSMIGAGSVVTSDIPSGVVAAGVPCKVIRKITEDDRLE